MASLLKKYGFHEWLAKTNFSFLRGASHPEDVIQTAIRYGYHSLAINDYDGIYGLARAWRALLRFKKDHPQTEFKLNYGAEIHFKKDHNTPLLLQQTLVLIALTHRGYANLCALLSFAHRGGKTEAHVPLENLLASDVSDLVAIQPMRGAHRTENTPSYFGDLYEHFKKRFYFAVSRHLHPAEDYWIPSTLALARRLNAKTLLSQDVFFHEPAQKIIHDLISAIRTNKTFNTCQEHFFPNAERCLHSLDYLEKLFSTLPVYEKSLKNSCELNEQCRFQLNALRYHYPRESIPPGHTAQSYLEHLTWKLAQEKFGNPIPEKIKNTLRQELDLIRKLEFADYFLTVWDIVSWARSQNILCQGRGSAANSSVCFVLGITSVNPALFDLLFERFVSLERGDPPDIDVDFEHERREEVIQYIYKRYGRDRAAMVANVITFKTKGALRAVGKALGVGEPVLNVVSKHASRALLRHRPFPQILNFIRQEAKISPVELAKIPFRLWAILADKITGFPRHLGIHSGGFMIADKPLDELVPQEPATMPGRTVIQWCQEDIEELGFFKIDILALRMLTAIRKCLDMIQRYHHRALSLATIPPDDPATYDMICRADTVGVFQIESRAQMSLLVRLKPACFYDLVIQVGIVRPGPIQGKIIHPYLKRRWGLEPVSFPHEKLKPILSRTLGISIFQEQVMRVAMAVGDFTPGEANELRKNIGVWSMKGFVHNLDSATLSPGNRSNCDRSRHSAEFEPERALGVREDSNYYGPRRSRPTGRDRRDSGTAGQRRDVAISAVCQNAAPQHGAAFWHNLNPWLVKLQRGMKAHGIKQADRDQIIEQLKSFAHYGFPESHAISFALITYASSYLKCHYPAAFYASVLNAQPMGFYSPHAILQAARRNGVIVLPFSVNHSKWDHDLEQDGKAIRLGFRLIKGLSKTGIQHLETERLQNGPFKSFDNFLRRSSLYRDDFTALAAADTFAEFGLSRAQALWQAEAVPLRPLIDEEEKKITWPTEDPLERLKRDYAAFGTSLGAHPALIIKKESWCYSFDVSRLTTSKEMLTRNHQKDILVFGLVLTKQAPESANGMVFFTLEDESGFINLAFTPRVYTAYYSLIEKGPFLCARGKLQKADGRHSILVNRVFAPVYKKQCQEYSRKNKKAAFSHVFEGLYDAREYG